MAEHLGKGFCQFVAFHEARPVASIIVLVSPGSTAHYTRGAMDLELASPVRASQLLQATAIRHAVDAGCTRFHMGESGTSSSLADFKERFSKTAVGQFGSGWGWLVKDGSGRLSVEATSNAGNPLREGRVPLLTCDVWEHAYYIDYRNQRAKFVEAFWNLVNWDFVNRQLG
jgi:hypothetical protein